MGEAVAAQQTIVERLALRGTMFGGQIISVWLPRWHRQAPYFQVSVHLYFITAPNRETHIAYRVESPRRRRPLRVAALS
jgi:acyl-CoA thioesterase